MAEDLLTADFDYDLPPEFIAQRPIERRSASKLLVLYRGNGRIEHRHFLDLIDYLRPGDCLVVNETKVRPARLLGRKTTGAAVEVLLLSEVDKTDWEALCRPAKRLPAGARIIFDDKLAAEIIEVREAGKRLIRFFSEGSLTAALARVGKLALPPYIHETLDKDDRYQTVFAAKPGSVAAPTAGLHFTKPFLRKLQSAGIGVVKLTLDIGPDTFRPIRTATISGHKMHSETYEIIPEAAGIIRSTKAAGGRIVAVGTTTVRALESAASASGAVESGPERTDLFIRPGFKFKVVDLMVTNFHLPRSTLMVLVSAFAGRENIRHAYSEAIESGYRFYSFGDAMLVV
ncbi:MAG: tRNA preQ1(34) S-adenosylmethionine ribosyltransferase-isomerase QueA [Actinomycetota bacterium]|nr:tRNA preQ1(34) S-adenosylmethionine ribosyltransferase-isomerase QueA [Actinomycetota bacterium]